MWVSVKSVGDVGYIRSPFHAEFALGVFLFSFSFGGTLFFLVDFYQDLFSFSRQSQCEDNAMY